MKTLIVGTNFTSNNSLKTQGQFLFEALKRNGISVAITSKHRNYIRRIIDTITQILKLKKKDTIIIQVYSTKGIYLECLSVLLGKLKRCRVISTLHGGNIPYVYHHKSLSRLLLNLIFSNSDHVTVPSRYIAEHIPAVKKHHILIRNIIELDSYTNRYKKIDNSIRIFWMRAYHPIYDPFKAIKVLECLLNLGHDAELVMAGSDHGLKVEIENQLKSTSLSTRIKLFGMIDNTQKNEIAAQCNFYLSTNIIDNAPVSFLEMMAMGLPVISTNIGGIPYYVEHRKNALISTDNSAQNIAELIIEVHQNKTLQQSLIENGLNFIQEFSSDTVTQKWISLLSSDSTQTS